MSVMNRIVKVEQSVEFNSTAVAMGWDSGEQLLADLAHEDIITHNGEPTYLVSPEVGEKKSGKGLCMDDDIQLLTCYGDPTRWFVNTLTSYVDKKGNLWVKEDEFWDI